MKKPNGKSPGDGNAERIEILIAKKIEKYRKNNGLSRKDLAERMGVSVFEISRFENGHSKPSLLMCLELASALGLRLSDIIIEIERQKPK
jgi:transcriptional regulator with XRE-family HTH domain